MESDYIVQKMKRFKQTHFNPNSRILTMLEDKKVKPYKQDYTNEQKRIHQINNKDYLMNSLEDINATLKLYQNIIPLYSIDYYYIYLSFYSFEIGLNKVAELINSENCEFNFNESDIDIVFDKLDEYAQKLDEMKMRSACSD